MSYPLIEGELYVINIGKEWEEFYPVGTHEVVLKGYKWFNNAPLGTECYATNGMLFCPEWIIGMGSLIQENE